ncbi:MAG: histidine phosphatase family protein [Bacteroidetes bacterium]|nr:histidine phosphatase family protein [Bacteroidota bacterium]
MKKLYLVRHAKSSWEEPGESDLERPLMEKGIKRTQKINRFLNERGVKIDLMISSPAERAFQTALMIARGIGYPEEKIVVDRKIYDGYYDRILDLIYASPNEVDSLMIIGHNPTISHLANLFLHPGVDLLPTTGTVCISFATDKWESVPSVDPVSEFVVFPKMLPSE